MARRVEDLALGLSIISGLDYQDPFTNSFPIDDYRDVNISDLKIAYWTHQEGYEHARPTDETIEAIESAACALEKRGAKVEWTQPPVDIESMFQSTMAMYFHEGDEGRKERLQKYGAEDDELLQESNQVAMGWFRSHTKQEIEVLMEEWPALRRRVFASMEGFDAVLAPVCAKTCNASWDRHAKCCRGSKHDARSHLQPSICLPFWLRAVQPFTGGTADWSSGRRKPAP